MRPFIPLSTPLLLAALTNAMHADEAGINDFVVRSAGHGEVGVRYAHLLEHGGDGGGVWITSQSNEAASSPTDAAVGGAGGSERRGGALIGGMNYRPDPACWISARNATDDGRVLWRVNACSSSSATESSSRNTFDNSQFVPRHATLASTANNMVYSLDDEGVFRGWNGVNGGLVFDIDVPSTLSQGGGEEYTVAGVPRLLSATSDDVLVVGTVFSGREGDEALVLHDAITGQLLVDNSSTSTATASKSITAKSLLSKAKLSSRKSESAQIIDMISLSSSSVAVLVGYSGRQPVASVKGTTVDRNVGSFASMAWVEVKLSFVEGSSANGHDGEEGDGPAKELVYEVVSAASLRVDAVSSTPIMLSSIKIVSSSSPEKVVMLAIAASTTQLIIANVDVASGKGGGQSVEIDILHPYWRMISTIHVDDRGGSAQHVVRVAGVDDRYPAPRRIESLFLLSDESVVKGEEVAFQRVYGGGKSDEEVQYDALAYCPSMGVVVTAAAGEGGEGQTVASSFQISHEGVKSGRVAWSSLLLEGDATVVASSRGGDSGGLVQSAHLVECTADSMVVVFVARGGMNVALEVKADSGNVTARQLWSSEEALGSISSAVFLDETHSIESLDDGAADASVDDEEEMALRNLRFSNRIHSQVSSFKNFIFGGGALSSLASVALLSDEKKAERDFAFGFAKIAVLLSESMHRIIALDTAKKGRIVWSMNLHPQALWHKIVHGGQFVALSDSHGYGGVHDHEMLALSFVSSGQASLMEWKCFDGTTGKLFSGDTVSMSSDVTQVVPLRSSTHHAHESKSCRQVALVVKSDLTVSVVPDTPRSYSVVDETVSAVGRNGLFLHTVDEQTGELRALRVTRKAGSENSQGSDLFELVTVGTTIFDPSQETIVNVAYPQRGEAIQSPSTVLGDDALLLKYLNPHLVVVVTEATKSFLTDISPVSDGSDETANGFYNALIGSEGASGQKRKPLGAAKPGEAPALTASANTATPSLFISLIDSVSGQILHRASHAHAVASDVVDAAATMVPVVISENWVVYTYFNQRTRRTDVGVLTLHEGMIDKNGITAFSAPEQELTFSSLESAKPIVLSKTYGLAKPVTALGVTTTKAGISSKQFMFATKNDQVVSMDRRMLDPRRPNGELKESEKMEGLMRYSPILPIIPLRTPSHVYEVSSVQSIASTSANVESQSLMLAYGGPDVFFFRLAPSKGFDLLPDDFNRGLLSVVLVGLLVLLFSIQTMNKKKMATTVWS